MKADYWYRDPFSMNFANTFISKSIVISMHLMCIPRGLTARIAGFHPAGPGSTPGVGKVHFFLFFLSLNYLIIILYLV